MRIERLCWVVVLVTGCALSEVAPYPYDDHVTLAEDTEVRIDVLENDLGAQRVQFFETSTDLDGSNIDLGKRTEHGSVRVMPDQTVLYTPDRDFTGEDGFDYVASNGGGNTRAHVTIEVVADSTLFGEPVVLHDSATPLEVWPAALDGDARNDAVFLAGEERTHLAALRNAGGLSLELAEGCCEEVARHLLITDLDRDGRSDIVAIGGERSVSVLFNRTPSSAAELSFETQIIDFTSSAFGIEDELDSNWPGQAATGDFGGGEPLDLALGFSGARGVVVLFDVAAGTSTAAWLEVPSTQALAAADVNGDGVDDVIALGEDAVVRVFHDALLAGASEPSVTHALPSAGSVTYLQAADLDDNGMAELVLSNGAQLIVLNGQFEDDQLRFAPRRLETDARDFALGDVDGDGLADLLTTEDSRFALTLYRGDEQDGLLGFEHVADFPAYSLLTPLHAVDMNDDGVLDVLTTRCPAAAMRCEVIAIPGVAQQ
jgi:hypothetical protein